MPVNALLFQHQLALMKADRLASVGSRSTMIDLVGHYARQITEWRSAEGLPNIGWPRDERPEQSSHR